MWDLTTCLDFQASRRIFSSLTQLLHSDFGSNEDLRASGEDHGLFKALSFTIKTSTLGTRRPQRWKMEVTYYASCVSRSEINLFYSGESYRSPYFRDPHYLPGYSSKRTLLTKDTCLRKYWEKWLITVWIALMLAKTYKRNGYTLYADPWKQSSEILKYSRKVEKIASVLGW